MSDHSVGAKPDLLIPVLVLAIVLAVAYVYVVPFRLFVKGMICLWYSLISFIVLDFEAGRFFNELSVIMFQNYKYKHIFSNPSNLEHFENMMDLAIEQVRLRFFIFFSLFFVIASYLFKKNLRTVPCFYGKFDLKELMQKKYKLQIRFDKKGRIVEPFERVYAKVMNLKKKRNFPINLVARFYPPDSKERVFLYTGSYSYRFVPMKMEKTLREYLVDAAREEGIKKEDAKKQGLKAQGGLEVEEME